MRSRRYNLDFVEHAFGHEGSTVSMDLQHSFGSVKPTVPKPAFGHFRVMNGIRCVGIAVDKEHVLESAKKLGLKVKPTKYGAAPAFQVMPRDSKWKVVVRHGPEAMAVIEAYAKDPKQRSTIHEHSKPFVREGQAVKAHQKAISDFLRAVGNAARKAYERDPKHRGVVYELDEEAREGAGARPY